MLKRLLRPLRGYMQAELMAEIGALRLEAARHAQGMAEEQQTSLRVLRAELASLRVEMARRDEVMAQHNEAVAQRDERLARRDEMEPLVKQMQSALLTLTLNKG